MTHITDMALPDEVVEATASAVYYANHTQHTLEGSKVIAKAAIRAALQAMLDNGMAYEHYDGGPVITIKLRRLDADERKRTSK